MGWTTPKTWNFKDIPTFEEFNQFLRDNMIFLKEGVYHTVGVYFRRQTAAITIGTAGSWQVVNSNGLTPITIGDTIAGDFLEINIAARANKSWTIGCEILTGGTVIRRYSSPGGVADESKSVSIRHEMEASSPNVSVRMAVILYTAGNLRHGDEPELYGWMDIAHIRKPIV